MKISEYRPQINDMVMYKHHESRGSKPERDGSIGMVLRPTSGYEHNLSAYNVHWISGHMVKSNYKYSKNELPSYAVYTDCLIPAEIPYDPSQQGDTDDDI